MDIFEELELDFKNIIKIEHFLSEEITDEKLKIFRKRLQKDKQFREDYILMREFWRNNASKKENFLNRQKIEVEEVYSNWFNRKFAVAKQLMKVGSILLAATALLLFSLLFSLLFN